MAAIWLVAGVALALSLALGIVALAIALLLAPVVLLLGRWFLRRSGVHVVHRMRRTGVHERPRGRDVYEGEFRVLEERRERR